MIFSSRTSAPAPDSVIYVNAENPEQTICKPELEILVKKIASGLRKAANVKDDDVVLITAVLNFSSGTTGNPKACMITHRNLVANSEQTLHLDHMAKMRQSDPDLTTTQDVHCAYVPFYHAIVLMLVKSHLLSSYDVSSIKTLLCGAAPLQPELSAQLETIFSAGKAHTRQGWGMSEATMAVTLFAPDEFDPSHKSVGYIVPNVQIKIINDDGREMGYDEEGEALIQGPNIFKGYYKNPTATKEAWTEDGWLKTGDIVTFQSNGLLTIVDRKKELIKVKGFQVAPSELEGHLLQHQGVKDCAVIRVDRDGQEHPQAHIVRTGEDVTTQSILAFMDKRLSTHKRLTGGIIFTDAIPKSPSGKVLRRMLKDPQKTRNSHL
ncbi:hypothetical protein G7Z17_g3027 [Cylindrodendrum hubeiense]|uniref:Uncharacterized protein n=1 Tax=Cylindrodendrum hubeiense TaxID=595255 RepID=A0A9P5HHQ0_9HYPO|nr:hypothetical protein G7Z17_g3027 [Cylindrodendrum hubeiense]